MAGARLNFASLAEVQDTLYGVLWGLGPLELDVAVRLVGDALAREGLLHFRRLHARGATYAELKRAIEIAVRDGYLDEPRKGLVRAIEPQPKNWTAGDWHRALTGGLADITEPVTAKRAVALAAKWARDNMAALTMQHACGFLERVDAYQPVQERRARAGR